MSDELPRPREWRDVSSWPDAGESLRVTVGTAGENDRFLAALRSIGGGD